MAQIDKGGAAEENEDGVTLEKDSDINNAIAESKEQPDSDGSGADKKDGEVVGEEEGVVGEEEQDVETDTIETLNQKIAELEKRISQPAALAPKEEAPPTPNPISEEEWAKYEEERGIPRTAQTWVTQTLVRAVGDIQRMIDQRFSKLDRQESMTKLSQDPEYSDANKYSKEVDQYLAKVDPRFHSNAEVLKDAVIWARGMNYKKGIQTVRSEREINKRISGVARPASPGGSKGGSKSTVPLTAVEKSAASAMNMSEEEYRGLKGRGRIIAN